MKNFLWFLNGKPADEREMDIYNKAYRRSAAVVLEILLVAYLLEPLNITVGGNNIKLTSLEVIVPVSFIVSYFVGWFTVRNEDVSSRSKKFLP